MEQTVTAEFIRAMRDFSRGEMPRDVIDECRLCLMDYVACASFGAEMLRGKNERFLNAIGRVGGAAGIINDGRKIPSSYAAMINGINAHFAELDDGHRRAMLHPGTPVISAVLAVAQERKLDADHLLRGIITGYEATIRLACSIQPEHKLRGYHATGTCGTVGAAIGVAAALDYPEELWNTVVSAAATSASGLLELIDDGSECKPFNAGRAAASAVEAALFGVTGFRGPTDVIGGRRGLLHVLAEHPECGGLTGGAEGEYAIKEIYRKPYAACRHSHAAIEATLNLCKEHRLEIGEIRRILVSTYDLAVKGHDHTEIRGAGSAKMSIPYGVAAAARYGRVNFQQYEQECMEDRELNALMKRVSVKEDPTLSALVPEKRAAIVTIVTDGGTYMERVDYPLGEPENPMGRDALQEKYVSLMKAAGRSTETAKTIADCIDHIETRSEELFEII